MFKFLSPHNWTAFAFRRPVTVFMVLVSAILFGAVSFRLLPMELVPARDGIWMNVWVPYPNSTPEDNVHLIARPLEGELKTLRGLQRVESNSSTNGVNVNLVFEPGTDMKLAYVEVRDRVERVRPALPDEINRIWVRKFSSTDIPIMFLSLSWHGDRDALFQVVDEQLIPRIERIDGIAGIDAWGSRSRQVIIDLDEDLLKAYRVNVEQFIRAMDQANMDSPGGYVEDGGFRYIVRLSGAFETVEDIQSYPINERGLKLSDVARVEYRKPTSFRRFRLNGQDAVGMVISKESNANTVEVTAAVKETLSDLTRDPRWPGLTYFIFFEQSSWILNSLKALGTAGMWGGLFALGVLFFFLRRYRTTFIIAASIPASILVTFTVMYFVNTGYGILSLNLISLMGLMLGIGMLVDNAVVVLENIVRLRRMGLEPVQAAIQGAREVSVAVSAATLTTAIVFLPLLFIGGGNAQTEMREFGLVITISLISSLVMSLSFIPLLASRLLKEGRLPTVSLLEALEQRYAQVIGWVLNHRLDVALILGGFVILTFLVPMRSVTLDNSSSDPRRVWMYIEPGEFASLEYTDRFVTDLENQWMASADSLNIRAIRSDFRPGRITFEVFLHSGSDDSVWDSLRHNAKAPWVWGSLALCAVVLVLVRRKSNALQITAVLTVLYIAILLILGTQGGVQSYRSSEEVARIIRDTIPEVPGLVVRWRWGEGGEEDPRVSIALHGENPRRLEQIAEDVNARLSQLPEITAITTDLDNEETQDEVQVTVDREISGKFGLTPRRVAEMTLSGIRGNELRRLKTEDREIRVWVQSKEEDRETVHQLRDQAVYLDDGTQLPLATMASFTQTPAFRTVFRRDSETILMVRANTTKEGIETIGGKISTSLADLSLPRGYSWRLGDRWERLEEDTAAMMTAILLALVAVLLLLGSLFESYIDPLIIILVSIPFAYFGCYWMLWATGTNMSVLAMIGIVILIGVVVNNAIVFIDHIKHLEREGRLKGRELIIQAGRDRLRPILMTAFTTMLGLLPMAIGTATLGDQPYYPMGRSVMGGLIFSTIGAMIALPLVYSAFEDLRNWWGGIVARIKRPV